MSNVKVIPQADGYGRFGDGSEDDHGLSGEQLSPEQISVLAKLIDLTGKVSDQGEGDPAVKLMKKCISLCWGPAAISAIHTDGEDPDDFDSANLNTAELDNAKVTEPGGFQGMSLNQSLRELFRTGRASMPEVVRMSLQPARSVAVFVEARASVPKNTWPDGAKAEAARANRVANWALGGKYPS